MKNRKNVIIYSIVIVIFIVSLLARLWAINYIKYPMAGDALNYHNMASNYLETGVFGYSTKGMATESNAYVTPGYPLFLAAIYGIFGYEETGVYAVEVIQAILGALTVVLVFMIGKRISNVAVGIIASIGMIIYPSFLVIPCFHLTESLYSFLFFLYLYVHLRTFENEDKKMHLLSGLLFGLTVMVRPSIFPFFLAIYAYKWIVEKEKNIFIKMWFFIIGLLVAMIPWWIRNLMLFGKFILLCTQAGNPLLGGAYPPSFAPSRYPQENQFRIGISVIINGFKTYPKEYLYWFTLGKIEKTFKMVYLGGVTPSLKFMEIVHSISLYGGIIGATISIFIKKSRMISMYLIMSVGIILLFIPDERYAYPIMPLFMILTVYGLYEIVNFVKKRREKNA